ncbi:hypothetical protein CONCODRAFT_5662 [Conidiobolus coronatus NRRL 28638]|uniref:Cytochrome P450 n=1 Tax=Conidiobolus coronatus (strain ATCC 28846 / CBS 209.66 / NRRL 28638) TaxID=796925 RepID=A0A137P9B3_CONC2|nr:hypothetical protein CONCODRAFT_5662 [Conidiobolus coronatus NRRL 28638]|eukprot:KXN71590.1 hypothetical protein CONCODRAFT_5662 [Conidiobolus coronatus NRRL 28638]
MGTSKDAFDDEMAKLMGPMIDKHCIVRYFGPRGWSIIADLQLAKIIYNNLDAFYKNTNSDWKRMRKLTSPVFHQTWPIDALSKYTRDENLKAFFIAGHDTTSPILQSLTIKELEIILV